MWFAKLFSILSAACFWLCGNNKNLFGLTKKAIYLSTVHKTPKSIVFPKIILIIVFFNGGFLNLKNQLHHTTILTCVLFYMKSKYIYIYIHLYCPNNCLVPYEDK